MSYQSKCHSARILSMIVTGETFECLQIYFLAQITINPGQKRDLGKVRKPVKWGKMCFIITDLSGILHRAVLTAFAVTQRLGLGLECLSCAPYKYNILHDEFSPRENVISNVSLVQTQEEPRNFKKYTSNIQFLFQGSLGKRPAKINVIEYVNTRKKYTA